LSQLEPSRATKTRFYCEDGRDNTAEAVKEGVSSRRQEELSTLARKTKGLNWTCQKNEAKVKPVTESRAQILEPTARNRPVGKRLGAQFRLGKESFGGEGDDKAWENKEIRGN